jgi:hypothetical protein
VREAPAQPATSAPARGGIPRIQMDVTSVDKPVVYFHLDEGTRSLPLAFAVTPAGGGRVLEHFPPGELSGAGARLGYPHVRVSRGDCRGVYPAPTDAPCDTEDGICEVRELERYETTDADCVHVGEEAAGFLFYRTGPAQLRAPLSLGVESPTAVRVTRAPDQPFPTGADAWVMRVYRPHARRSTVSSG